MFSNNASVTRTLQRASKQHAIRNQVTRTLARTGYVDLFKGPPPETVRSPHQKKNGNKTRKPLQAWQHLASATARREGASPEPASKSPLDHRKTSIATTSWEKCQACVEQHTHGRINTAHLLPDSAVVTSEQVFHPTREKHLKADGEFD